MDHYLCNFESFELSGFMSLLSMNCEACSQLGCTYSTHQKLRSPAWKFSYYLSLDGTETFLLFPVVDTISPCLILIIASSEIKIIHVTSGLLNK